MANSYTRLYVQLVFSPSGRENILPVKHKEELHKYCTGIIQNRKHKLLAINNLKDHIHIFIGYNPGQLLPDLVRDIKSSSSKFINENSWLPVRFQWQEGYGGFSYSHSDVDKIIKYINNQETHHNVISFKDEYHDLLKQFEVEYNPDYLFKYY